MKNSTRNSGGSRAKINRGGNREKSVKKPRIDNMPSSKSQAISRTAIVRKIDLDIVRRYEDTKFRYLAYQGITKVAILPEAGIG